MTPEEIKAKLGITILKRVYLANSYTPKGETDPDMVELVKHRRRALEAYIAGKIKKQFKVCVVPPIAISATMADICSFGHGFDEWAGDDYTHIYSCDEVWVLVSEGWKESYGVQSEIKYAKSIGLPVRYITEQLEFMDLSEVYK